MTTPMTPETTDLENTAAAYLKLPYFRGYVPEDDGTFRAEVLEFSGCIATGDTAAEAIACVEEAAKEWIVAALSQGQKIPDPAENTEFSGKLVLRLPRSLHKKSARFAERDGVSLNQLIITSLANYVGQSEVRKNQISEIKTINVVSINEQYTWNINAIPSNSSPRQFQLSSLKERTL